MSITRFLLGVTLGAVCWGALAPVSTAAPADFCRQLGGAWSPGEQFCGQVITNINQSKTVLEARFPADLVEDRAAGPVLQSFLKQFFVRFAKVSDDPGATDGGATLRYRLSEHPQTLKSVMFSDIWYQGNAKYPVEELASFTFDSAKGKSLALADLFQPGVSSSAELARLSHDTVQRQLDPVNDTRVSLNQPKVRPEDFEPGGTLNKAGYQVFTVSADELVLYLPKTRNGAPGTAMIEAHVPLAALKDLLRPEYR